MMKNETKNSTTIEIIIAVIPKCLAIKKYEMAAIPVEISVKYNADQSAKEYVFLKCS